MDGRDTNDTALNRSDFLKVLGAGAASLAALGGAQAFADMADKGKYVIVITHGGNDPNRAIFALLMAGVVAKKGWGKVHVWMTLEGADLAHKDKTERVESPIFKKFGNAMELMEKLREQGAWFGVCPPCAEYAGAVDDHRHHFVHKAGGDWLMENIQDAWVLWM